MSFAYVSSFYKWDWMSYVIHTFQVWILAKVGLIMLRPSIMKETWNLKTNLQKLKKYMWYKCEHLSFVKKSHTVAGTWVYTVLSSIRQWPQWGWWHANFRNMCLRGETQNMFYKNFTWGQKSKLALGVVLWPPGPVRFLVISGSGSFPGLIRRG